MADDDAAGRRSLRRTIIAVDRSTLTIRGNGTRLIGAKRALKQQQVWAIRFWLDQHRRLHDRARFDFAIDSKLRGCDVVGVRIGDVVPGGRRYES